MTESSPRIDWQPHSVAAEPSRGLRDDAARVVLLLAALALFLGGLLPWAEGIDATGHAVSYTPQAGLAEGYVMMVVALILAALSRGRVLLETTSRTVQLVPLALAVVAGAMWLGADRASLEDISLWQAGGGTGAQTAWRLVTGAAIAGIVTGTIWLDFARPADVRARTSGLIAEWRVSRVGFAEAVAAAVLGFGGAIASGAVTIIALGPNGAIFAVFVTLFGMAAGISAGLGIVRWARGGAERGSSDAPRSTTTTAAAKEKVSASRVVRRRS